MSTTSYRRIIVQLSDPDPTLALRIVETPMTEPAAHEVLVRNHYAGVNNTDISRMMGITETEEHPPFDFGLEAIGIIEAVGSKVEGLEVGDAVVTVLPGNGFREYARIAANLVVKIPAIKPEYLVLFLSGAAAKIALEHIAEIKSGEILVVTAPFSGSGHMAIQLAKRSGALVIVPCVDDEEAAILADFNIDRIINRSRETVADALRAYSNRINIVYDALGGTVLDECLRSIAPKGRVVLADAVREQVDSNSSIHQINIYRSLINKSVTIKGINLSDYARQIGVEGLNMVKLYHHGEIKALVDPTEFTGIERVSEAIQYAIRGKIRGKVIVKLT